MGSHKLSVVIARLTKFESHVGGIKKIAKEGAFRILDRAVIGAVYAVDAGISELVAMEKNRLVRTYNPYPRRKT